MMYKEILRTDKLLFICPYCGVAFRALAHHTVQKHGISGEELRRRHGLKKNYQLITPCLKERHRTTALRDGMGDKLKEWGKISRYAKGHKGHIKEMWSPQAIEELRTRKTKKKQEGKL